ncbi:hypothetical protein J7337_013917 [Fusarium musae]|uniref:Uncharacterized protein n=1 Tax=Fusarium musae TaxID=1042133 RepID=A0A9P8D3Q9_9HYPO|nr:hypothetical protein J7337_013917 [Fusarium musae]KAG9494778.1 hypothetical protein J7337_013917 [Fusarium musae]
MDNQSGYNTPLSEVSDKERGRIKRYIGEGNLTSEPGTARTGGSLRTTQVNLSDLSEDRKHILAARMKQTRDEWDRSEYSANTLGTVDGGSVAHSHKTSQVGFGNLANRRQGQRAPAVPALTTRGQRATRSLGSGRSLTSTRGRGEETNIDTPGSITGGFAPASRAHTAAGALPAPKSPAAAGPFVPATTGIGSFVPGPKAPTATGVFAPVPTAPTGVSGFPPAPKAPTKTGGFRPVPKALSVISATTTVIRDPTANPGQTTTPPSLKVDKDASQLGTGSSEQTEEQFKELIDEMAALQQSMSVNEQKQRWMFFNLQKQRKEKGAEKN